jgi:hypothetical protein
MQLPLVLTKHVARSIDKISGSGFSLRMAFDKCRIIAVGNKTNILTIGFCGNIKAE